MRIKKAVVAVPCLTLILAVGEAGADLNWPQLRGPTAQGIAADVKDLPVTWSESQNIAWKTPIHGKAWSSPAVYEDQIWLTTATPDGKVLSAVCVDKKTGKIVIDETLFNIAAPQYCHSFNSYASPSPVMEGDRVWLTFGSAGTACLDRHTGKVLWDRRDFVCNHFRGAGSSPMVYKDLLILPFDGSDFQYIVAMDKNTGKTVWKTDRSIDFQDLTPEGKPGADGDMRKAFSTPRIGSFGGKDILVSLGSKCLYAYDPADGKELWRIENRSAHSGGTTPVIGPDFIYYSTGAGRTELCAVKPPAAGGGGGNLPESDIVFKVKKNVPTRASVLLVDDLIYMVDDGGVASCVEAKTGAEVWKQRIGGNYSASPLYGDGRIYFFSEDGKATVIAPGREFKQLAENHLDDGFMASPAASDGALFLRTRTSLYRVEKKR